VSASLTLKKGKRRRIGSIACPREPFLNAFPIAVALVLDHASVTGGAAKVAFDSAIGLKRAGYRPIVFAAAGPVDPGLVEARVEVVCLGQHDILNDPSRLRAAVRGIWNVEAARRLSVLLASLPKGRSLVHVHGWAKGLSPAIAGPIAASGLPALCTLHEYFLFCPNGGFYNYQTEKVCELEPMSGACVATNCDSRSYPQKLWRCARQAAVRHVARLPKVFSDFIIISDLQDGIARARLPEGARIHRLTNPIEAARLGLKPRPASGDFLFVGRIAREKGPLLFAEAARRAGIVPTYVGDGPIRAELAGRYPEARILGWKTPDEARAMMRQGRALVFPSLWYEVQGLTVSEAKAMGTPVVVSDVCAGREAIEDGKSGLWFRNGDPDALACALDRLKDDVLVEKLSNHAYAAYWADPPTLERHVGALLDIYEGMLCRWPEPLPQRLRPRAASMKSSIRLMTARVS
jgi:glycosyltransferase involved in cell wall biosynthesis